jgi:hypothetical protein
VHQVVDDTSIPLNSYGQQDNIGLNKERQKSQPPRRRNQEESSNPEENELENRI